MNYEKKKSFSDIDAWFKKKKKQRAVTKKIAFEITIIINQMKLLMYEG